ncbi:rhodanese-like domain-containing protein [Bacteroidota bacterium]
MMKNYLLPAISACLLLLVILSLPGKDCYMLNAFDLMERIGNHNHILSSDILDSPDGMTGKVLVDLRKQDVFQKSHLPGAVSLPADELNVESIREFFNESEVYLLYAEETSRASQVWILITQMGIENVLVLDLRNSNYSL